MTVVARVVVDVVEARIVVSSRVAVPFRPSVEFPEAVTTGTVTTVDWVRILSIVVVGTDRVCVVDCGSSVVLVNGAIVLIGSRVDSVTEGKLVGNGSVEGLPSVSKVLWTLLTGSAYLRKRIQ